MSVFYHPSKAKIVVDVVSQMTMVSVSHLDEPKKDLAMEVYRLVRLG